MEAHLSWQLPPARDGSGETYQKCTWESTISRSITIISSWSRSQSSHGLRTLDFGNKIRPRGCSLTVRSYCAYTLAYWLLHGSMEAPCNLILIFLIRYAGNASLSNLPNMLVSRKRTSSLPPPILYVSGTPLQHVTSVRYLGVELTQDLSWSLHISARPPMYSWSHLCAKLESQADYWITLPSFL